MSVFVYVRVFCFTVLCVLSVIHCVCCTVVFFVFVCVCVRLRVLMCLCVLFVV